jgi:hypothetical protein
MSLIGIGALYWAVSGQWKYNRMMEEKHEEKNKEGE